MVYKLTYFNCRGLGEPIRLMLVDQGIAYEDERFEVSEWPQFKPSMTFGQAPVLYEGDKQIAQTGTINRHLARKHNLNGSNECESTFIDMVFEGCRDLRTKYGAIIYGNFEADRHQFATEVIPQHFTVLENLMKTYCNGEKFVAGEKISYVDYSLFELLDIMLVLEPTILDKFPILKAFHSRMNSRPSLHAYLEKRAISNIPINGNGKQ